MENLGWYLIAFARWRGSQNRRRPQALLTESPWMGEVGGVRRRFVLARADARSLDNLSE